MIKRTKSRNNEEKAKLVKKVLLKNKIFTNKS